MVDENKPDEKKDMKEEQASPEDDLLKKYGTIAEEILRKNPIDYIVKTMSKMHLGDDSIKTLLLLASFSPYVLRSNEYIHVTVIGPSGMGKSNAVQAFLACLPPNFYEYWSGCSEKYPFYHCMNNPKILDKKILYVDDDVLIDASFVRSIKTPSRNGIVNYGTVMDQKPIELRIIGTPVVFESKVRTHIDSQDRTRSLLVEVDNSEDHQKLVRRFIIENECMDKKSEDVSGCFIIAQTIYLMLIRSGWKDVIISEELGNKIPEFIDARKLKRFIGLIKCSAFVNQFRREHRGNSLIATEEDLNVALSIYSSFLSSEIFGVDSIDIEILKILQISKDVDYDKIALLIKKSYGTAYNRVQRLAENGLVTTFNEDRKDFVLLTDSGSSVLQLLGASPMQEDNKKNNIKIKDDTPYPS